MTSDLRTAAQQALEALESAHGTVTETDWKIDYSKEIAALRAALAEPQTTHSEECYKLHHDCAVAEVERLRLLCEEMLSELYVYRASKQLKDAIRARKENI